MHAQKNLDRRSLAVSFIFVFYFIIRFFFTTGLDALGPYASYLFEVIIVTSVFVIYRGNTSHLWTFNKSLAAFSLLALASGYVVYKAAGFTEILIPFDLSGAETIFFLLVVAPVLEEFIFRYVAWLPIAKLGPGLALMGTSLLFSYSHLHAIWSVPPEFHSFIYYQSGYTLFLGLVCGYSVLKYNSLTGAIAIHFGFNLGFYLGSLV